MPAYSHVTASELALMRKWRNAGKTAKEIAGLLGSSLSSTVGRGRIGTGRVRRGAGERGR